ncbi:MAG: photosystem II cytochrome PsbV2 [Synechococcaceae cyanobacterium SM2_3_1]|nr:photosystem II cytochrome PsbV2 [Synechococcaceae cyanobacterium SM2_3_1]
MLLLCLCAAPAWARIDTYVNQYLQVSGPIELPADASGTPITITPEQLEAGKALFQNNCLNCHVGGSTLPDPRISLSLKDLQRATPPRDNLASLMEFQRDPLNYNGTDVSFGCRPVSRKWMSDEELQTLTAFVLRAAQKAPGWGIAQLER